jgi:hypothetical protein
METTACNPASQPGASLRATGCWMVGLLIAWRTMPDSLPSEIGARTALVVGATLVMAVALEVCKDWRAVLRPDIVAFFVLYFFTFLEFLFPQPGVDGMISTDSFRYGCVLCFVAFGSMAIGRHLAPRGPAWLHSLVQRPTSPKALLSIFWLSFFLGYFYMLLAVNFDVVAMVDWMMAPRYWQPWSRGRYGDWRALLNEVGKIINLAPPLAGLILAKRERYAVVAYVAVILALLFCFFEGFASGSRNILAMYLVTFLVGYGVNLTKKRRIEFLIFCCLAAVGFYQATTIMLTTRTIGLKGYFSQDEIQLVAPEAGNSTFVIDLDLVNISQLTERFPADHPFLGLEVPYTCLIRPVPRALWPGKPEGLSMSIETALGVYDEGHTLSTTFVGEAYMAGGVLGIVVAGIIFGSITHWWGRFAFTGSSEFGFLIYASGFMAVTISIRSMFEFLPASLPTIAAVVIAPVFARKPESRFYKHGKPHEPAPARFYERI